MKVIKNKILNKLISVFGLFLIFSCAKMKEDIYVIDTVSEVNNKLYILRIKGYDYNVATKDSTFRVGDTLIFAKKK